MAHFCILRIHDVYAIDMGSHQGARNKGRGIGRIGKAIDQIDYSTPFVESKYILVEEE